jgi:hypothetical protein
MPALDACPLCRSTIGELTTICPGCAADLTPYRDIAGMTERYMQIARERISRGELVEAEAIVSRLGQLGDVDGQALASLQLRLALACQEPLLARSLLERVPTAQRELLEAQILELEQREETARELYNQALSAARRGEYARAARQMELCVKQFGADPALWELKLKLDLKCSYFLRVYGDLKALDGLNARPTAWVNLEEILPAV